MHFGGVYTHFLLFFSGRDELEAEILYLNALIRRHASCRSDLDCVLLGKFVNWSLGHSAVQIKRSYT